MKCNLIVPGFAKSGTSSLHNYLDLHPDICMSRSKEPHYFSRDDNYAKGTGWHDSLFAKAQPSTRIFGESSTTYSLDEIPLQRIKTDIGNPKLIILLRDPLERLISHFNWLWALNLENRQFLKAINEEEKTGYNANIDICGCYPAYLRASRYSFFLPLIKEIFGRNNVLCLNSKQLMHNQNQCLDKCFSFLNVSPFAIEDTIIENKTAGKQIQRTFGIEKITRILPKNIRNLYLYQTLSSFSHNVFGKKIRKPPKIKHSEIAEVRIMLKDDIKYFENLFCR